jgi:DNA-binding NarL/FixJ family response regulator
VVDDHEVVRQGLVALLSRQERFQVVAEASTVTQALEAARTYHPDLVVMDARLPDGSGIAACREIRAEHAETRVVILTGYADQGAVVSASCAVDEGEAALELALRDAARHATGRGDDQG